MLRNTSAQIQDGIRHDIFGRHIAKRIVQAENDGIQIIRWVRPNSHVYAVRYMINANYLHVTGDAGDAIYRFNEILSWPDFLSTYPDYFASKCVASEAGVGYKTWNGGLAQQRLHAWVEENPEVAATRARILSDIDALSECLTKDGWHCCLRANENILEADVLKMTSIGSDIDVRCAGHLVGLQMAIKQLQEAKLL